MKTDTDNDLFVHQNVRLKRGFNEPATTQDSRHSNNMTSKSLEVKAKQKRA